MAAKFYQPGQTIDYTPPAAVTAGQMVKLGTGSTAKIGVAVNDIAANKKGQLTISGVFKIDSNLGASTAVITEELDVNFTTQKVEAGGAGDANCQIFVAAPVTANSATVLAFINAFNG